MTHLLEIAYESFRDQRQKQQWVNVISPRAEQRETESDSTAFWMDTPYKKLTGKERNWVFFSLLAHSASSKNTL